ncbi:hypothetical protein VKT23_002883 [Stygiomarasmius scandens]|uniref:Uncharacterized protein n=1 Tax=Marasmiellus scandens TaxID=2682957 RepID=A0ABR1JXY5_9AGAR
MLKKSSILKNLKHVPGLSTRLDLWQVEVRPMSRLSYCQVRRNTTLSAELGVRKDHPPDSTGSASRPISSSSGLEPEPKKPNNSEATGLSDRDWEVRTGRAIDILQNTLPHFFETGLITSIDKSTGEPKTTSSLPLPAIHLPAVNSIPGLQSSSTRTSTDSENQLESIYSPKVRLSYTPPAQLPAPFPKTLTVEGIPLYLASSVFIRHTLNALYTDLHVTLHKVVVNTPKSKPGSLPPPVESETGDARTPEEAERDKLGLNQKGNREKSVFIGLRVIGTSRVSGADGQWEVNSTYSFSPVSGLIHLHTINSIEPAPHLTVYDALRMSLGNVFGYGIPSPEGEPRSGRGAPATCTGKRDVCTDKGGLPAGGDS